MNLAVHSSLLHQRSFVLTFFFTLAFLCSLSIALPIAQEEPKSLATIQKYNSPQTVQVNSWSGRDKNETCTIVTSSTADGCGVVKVLKRCSFTVTTSRHLASTTDSPLYLSSNIPFTTLISSASPSSTSLGLSLFSANVLPSSSSTDSANEDTSSYPTATPQVTATREDAEGNITSSDHNSLLTLKPVTTTSPTGPFAATAQSHLSSLPIFLGALGGIAGLSLLVVGIKVYQPIQRLNKMRNQRNRRYIGNYNDEKWAERTSQEGMMDETSN